MDQTAGRVTEGDSVSDKVDDEADIGNVDPFDVAGAKAERALRRSAGPIEARELLRDLAAKAAALALRADVSGDLRDTLRALNIIAGTATLPPAAVPAKFSHRSGAGLLQFVLNGATDKQARKLIFLATLIAREASLLQGLRKDDARRAGTPHAKREARVGPMHAAQSVIAEFETFYPDDARALLARFLMSAIERWPNKEGGAVRGTGCGKYDALASAIQRTTLGKTYTTGKAVRDVLAALSRRAKRAKRRVKKASRNRRVKS